eukprot:CFRG6609T1
MSTMDNMLGETASVDPSLLTGGTHKREHSEESSPTEEQTASSAIAGNGQPEEKKPRFACQSCGKSYASLKTLTTHHKKLHEAVSNDKASLEYACALDASVCADVWILQETVRVLQREVFALRGLQVQAQANTDKKLSAEVSHLKATAAKMIKAQIMQQPNVPKGTTFKFKYSVPCTDQVYRAFVGEAEVSGNSKLSAVIDNIETHLGKDLKKSKRHGHSVGPVKETTVTFSKGLKQLDIMGQYGQV